MDAHDVGGTGGLLIRGARVVTLADGAGGDASLRPRRGAGLRELMVLDQADVLVHDGVIAAVGQSLARPAGGTTREIEADGRVLVPGFVDAHTHACWAGDRLDEWESRRAGVAYLDILRAGGGIMSTVRSVRAASEETLAALLLERLNLALAHGTTAIEVKSGYGLTTADELKMLRAARRAAEAWPGRVVLTACVAHALDPEQTGQVDRTIGETLPAVHEAFPGVAIDGYCEKGAWSLDDCVRLFTAARQLGHPVRVHADQFNTLGMLPAAVRLGARSVDHLEASRPDELRRLGASETAGVLLPAAGFHLDGRYADGRALIDSGGIPVVASNWNPGSAACWSVPMAAALAVRCCGLSPAEALHACTANAAWLLGLMDCGRIAPGLRADLVLLAHRDERELGHSFGGNPAVLVVCGGRVVAETGRLV